MSNDKHSVEQMPIICSQCGEFTIRVSRIDRYADGQFLLTQREAITFGKCALQNGRGGHTDEEIANCAIEKVR